MRRLLITSPLLMLAACGFNGTDGSKDQTQAAGTTTQAAAPTPAGPDYARLAPNNIPDAVQRPVMQAQVVLDSQGFGPGIIDGKEGISLVNALKGFQEAQGLPLTGKLDDATKMAMSQWSQIPATKVIRIPDSWGQIAYHPVPKEPAEQAKLSDLGYRNLDEKLAERFHTTTAVLKELNPGGEPATLQSPAPVGSPSPTATATPKSSASAAGDQPIFHAGQMVRVPNVGLDAEPTAGGSDADWATTLASLGIAPQQPQVARIVVDKSEGWLKGYDAAGKVVAMFTVTTGSQHDPLPLGEWKIVGIDKNPKFHYNPDLFWDAKATDKAATLPPGPNGPVGVVWIDLSKEHYGIHGTPEPQTIGRTESHGCVRLTNWDAARLAQMTSTSTKVVFQA
jgi:lipoprotein-anchoring transpeptidase ErfK/SrfK